MNNAAIGVRMHSGWGALVVVTGHPPQINVLDRRSIVITDPQIPGAKQPYHFAADMELCEAEQYLRNCAAVSEGLALTAVGNVIEELNGYHYRAKGAAVLLASGRPLPALAQVLASHALIHTAEGEFFRKAVWTACERLNLRVVGFRESDLIEQANVTFGKVTPHLQQRIISLKNSLGAPWTEDQKKATLAASIILRG
jgi:hypothetical protein